MLKIEARQIRTGKKSCFNTKYGDGVCPVKCIIITTTKKLSFPLVLEVQVWNALANMCFCQKQVSGLTAREQVQTFCACNGQVSRLDDFIVCSGLRLCELVSQSNERHNGVHCLMLPSPNYAPVTPEIA